MKYLLLSLALILLLACTRSDIAYYDNGNKKHELHYRNGQLDGVQYWYYRNGNLQALYHYRKGKPDGKAVSYRPNGQPEREQSFTDGLLDGREVIYSMAGQKEAMQQWTKGKKNGIYRAWHKNGRLMIAGYFKNDLWDSVWTWYDSFGRTTARGMFKMGAGTMTAWYSNGKLRRKSRFKNNQKEGMELLYNDKGVISDTLVYHNGILQ